MKKQEKIEEKIYEKEKFPGFTACMKMMRKRNSQTQEDGFWFLEP